MARKLPGLLFPWFENHRRDFAWRKDRDPYKIWVSEVMLQQTVAATVGPFFQRFLERFPNLEELAKATQEDVLHAWQGLGYYRRARMMHAAARKLVALGYSQIPDSPEILESLPGLGRYTINAVLSQAFDRPLPILEANTYRLLARLFALLDDPRSKNAEKWLWQTAEKLVPLQKAGDFNQALMELGSLICVPNQPTCLICPVTLLCRACSTGTQGEIPKTTPKAPPTPLHEVAVAIQNPQGQFLLVKRGEKGRWVGMWELPRAEVAPKETENQAALRITREMTGLELLEPAIGKVVQHAVTRYKVKLSCWTGKTLDNSAVNLGSHVDHAWVMPGEFGNYPVASPQRKLMAWLAEK